MASSSWCTPFGLGALSDARAMMDGGPPPLAPLLVVLLAIAGGEYVTCPIHGFIVALFARAVTFAGLNNPESEDASWKVISGKTTRARLTPSWSSGSGKRLSLLCHHL